MPVFNLAILSDLRVRHAVSVVVTDTLLLSQHTVNLPLASL